ncbi:glycosyltransferase [Endozoicomonas ascidiicola]|uniref:glycosyltransferase n=1 Tax=Endozoicomonas ascidiicola TaxID=1698521 RepID=UPI000834867C|nr:glycosyltransferase [Endozoicomonas ascidiicola]
MTDFVVFGEDWGAFPSSTQHLIRHLMPKHRVIWVNSIGLRAPKLTFRDTKRLFLKAWSMFRYNRQRPKCHNDAKNPYIIEPLALPFHQFRVVRKLNQYLLSQQINKVIKQQDFSQITLLISLPTAADLVGCFGEKKIIYYCGDDFEALEHVDHQPVSLLEQELAHKADLIVTASQNIAKKFPAHKTVALPHGVDYQLFSTPTDAPKDTPNSGYVAGFYGTISSWIDTELLSATAKTMPQWQFVLIGHVKVDITLLKDLPNVHFLGFKPHHELPAYVQHWDVALLPFQRNPQIEACNPLKLKEYLASGTPVAATRFPAAEEYQHAIAIQSPGEDFSNVITRAYLQQNKAAFRRQLVADKTWQHRADQLEDLIEKQ